MDVLSELQLRPNVMARVYEDRLRSEDPVGDEGTGYQVDYRPTFVYEAAKSSLGRALFEATGFSTYAEDMDPVGPPAVGFRNEHRIVNDPGSDRVLIPAWSFISQPGYHADGATVQLQANDVGFEQIDFWAQPFYLTKDSGVLDGTTLGDFTSKSFAAGIWAHGNVWIDGWTGYEVKAPTLTEALPGFDDAPGVINHVIGIDIADLTEGAVSNRALSLGAGGLELRAAAEPSGALTADVANLIYLNPDGKLVIKYNDGGTVRYRTMDLNGTGVAFVHSLSAP